MTAHPDAPGQDLVPALPTPHPTPVPTGPPVTLALQHSWDFTGTDTSTPLCVTAQYLYIDGSAAAGYLNLHEVVLKGADGTGYTIASGAMSSTYANTLRCGARVGCAVFQWRHKWNDLCTLELLELVGIL